MSMEDAERFARQHDANNREIFENLCALRGELYAELASETANIMLVAKGMTICGMPPDLIDPLHRSMTGLIMAICADKKWDGVQFTKDMEIFFHARYNRTEL